MILLQTHQLSKAYGSKQILTNINLEVHAGDRVGLVGRNGAGKSTLLKILVGEIAYDEGEIFKAKETTIGYLAQDSGLDSQATIWEEMLTVFTETIRLEEELRHLEQQLAKPESIQDDKHYQQLLDQYSRLMERFSTSEDYQYEASIRSVLHGLRFDERMYTEPIANLSGGQKTRLALGKLLLQKPDLLILDEPTNYLDLETLAWLEEYLKGYPGSILVVSHDRYFLDALVNVIYEIERTKATKYHGNYTYFLKEKAKQAEREWKLFKKQQQEIAKIEDFIRRNIARASTARRAQSRRKQLDKMTRMDRPQTDGQHAFFTFSIERPSGNDCLTVENVAIGYHPEEPLSQNLNFQAYRGDSIAIVGPNGIGKTTLLKTIVGEIPALSGSIRKGANVTIGYYEQEQKDLHPEKTVLREIWDDYPHLLEKEVRSLLGQFLFSGEEVEKRVGELSGGEKARLALAKLMLQKANLLILDEPTNHLDVYSKEVLEEALLDYPGTIIFVSHDRYFLNRIATKVIELRPDGLDIYLGDFDYYMEKKRELEEITQLEEKKKSPGNQEVALHPERAKLSYEQGKELKRQARRRERKKQELEEQMEALEKKMGKLEAELCKPEVYQDYEQAAAIQTQLEQAQREFDQLFETWSILEEGD